MPSAVNGLDGNRHLPMFDLPGEKMTALKLAGPRFAARRRDERLQAFHQTREPIQGQLLRAIAPGLGGVGMDFDQQPVRPHGCRALAKARHQIRPARSLAGVDDDRAMRFILDDGNGGKVQRVAGVSFEGADAPFAEDLVGIII